MPKQKQKNTTAHLDQTLIDLLLKSGIITEDLLGSLKKRSEGIEDKFERLILNEGYLTEDQLATIKAKTYGWSFINLRGVPLSEEVLSLLPRSFIESRKVAPFKQKDQLGFAMANPKDHKTRRILEKKFGKDMKIFYTTNTALVDSLARFDTGFSDRVGSVLEHHAEALKEKDADDKSIIELVDHLLLHGVRQRASDIHIEPRRHEAVVRFRVDGILKKMLEFDKKIHELVSLRIKVMANLATDEHARPQDGKLQFEDPEGKRVDVRVAVGPTTDGEKIVMRLLAPQERALPLDGLGLLPDQQKILEEEQKKSWGMILVTGPTGSGKTTSLYAVVRRLHNDSINISTIEDPVEYDLPGVNQMQVNEKVEVNFVTGLKTLVRQDPNVILVGEIRDTDTADIAVNAAMTGHLVFSTLHTNDAPTALPRLVDMGIEPFLISSTVNLIVAQRLVRKTCEKCREGQDVPVEQLKDSLTPETFEKLTQGKSTVRVYHGKGCKLCSHSGYHGRTGIFEMLQVTDEIRDLIMQNADADAIKTKAVEQGMITMMDDGIEKVLSGVTTIEEILRVIRS